MVIAEQIYNSFRSVFADLMTEKGLVWNGKCFVGCANNLITRISVCYNVNRYNAKVDVRVFQIPICCITVSDITTQLKWGMSVRRLAMFDNLILPEKYDYRNESVDTVMQKYFEYICHIFEEKFVFSSVNEFVEKKIDVCKNRYELYNFGENEQILKHQTMLDVDVISLIYAYYKIVGVDKSHSLITVLLQLYGNFLYDKMKFGNIAELGNIYTDKEIRTLNKIFENYEKITHFAEALFQDNQLYFSEIEKSQLKNTTECKNYINNLTQI